MPPREWKATDNASGSGVNRDGEENGADGHSRQHSGDGALIAGLSADVNTNIGQNGATGNVHVASQAFGSGHITGYRRTDHTIARSQHSHAANSGPQVPSWVETTATDAPATALLAFGGNTTLSNDNDNSNRARKRRHHSSSPLPSSPENRHYREEGNAFVIYMDTEDEPLRSSSNNFDVASSIRIPRLPAPTPDGVPQQQSRREPLSELPIEAPRSASSFPSQPLRGSGITPSTRSGRRQLTDENAIADYPLPRRANPTRVRSQAQQRTSIRNVRARGPSAARRDPNYGDIGRESSGEMTAARNPARRVGRDWSRDPRAEGPERMQVEGEEVAFTPIGGGYIPENVRSSLENLDLEDSE